MKFIRKIATLFSRRKLDADMSEEMRLHLDQRTHENLEAGLSPTEARYAALRKFGGVEQVKERAREQRPGRWFEDALQDARYAARQMRRNPGFAVTAILILAFGIGATTAIFSVVNAVVLKPLPYDQPGQLVRVFETPKPGDKNVASTGVFMDWREEGTLFEGFAAYGSAALNFIGGAEPQRLNGVSMTVNALQLLRVQPVVGRLFASDEDQPGKEKVVLLTHQMWQRRFGGEREVVGRTVLFNDERYTVVGVLPEGFWPFAEPEFVIPYTFGATARDARGNHSLRVLGRLRPGVTVAQGEAELTAVVERHRWLYPAWKKDWGVVVVPLHEELVNEIKPALLVLLGAVGLVLLLACTNVANLLLVRASARQKEIAVRAALGASRGRIVRQLLAESVFLSGLGAVLGLLLAAWSLAGLRQFLGAMNLVRVHEIALDGSVLGLALVVSLLTGIGFGLAPALQTARPNLGLALKEAARGSVAGGGRLRNALIVSEVALALALLVGAGLMLHSFARILDAPVGFEPAQALTMQLTLSDQRYPDLTRCVDFYQRVTERVAALPGVEAAGVNAVVPLRGGGSDRFFRVIGRADQPEPGYDIDYDSCTSDYFRAMGVPLLRGRLFTASEVAGDAQVAVINATVARELFPNEDPIGRRLGYNDLAWEIVGIVGDVRMRNLLQPARALVYRPRSAEPWRTATLTVRTKTPPLALAGRVRQAISELDPNQPVANVRTLEQVVARSVADRRLTLALLGGFAVAALVLAATGLYGVIAYAVAQRRREFGIRLALGASGGQVRTMVLGEGMKLAALGLVIGLAGAFGLSRLLGHLLYEIKPTDPLTFGAVSILLLAVAALASWLPARRAAKTDPMLALRAE